MTVIPDRVTLLQGIHFDIDLTLKDNIPYLLNNIKKKHVQ